MLFFHAYIRVLRAYFLRVIPLKKVEEGGRKISVTPSDKIGIFQPRGPKRVFSLTPSAKKGFFYPVDMFLFSCDKTVLSNFTPLIQFSSRFYPPRTLFFSVNFTPLGQFFVTFTPSDSFFTDFNPVSQIFSSILLPRTVYLDNFIPLRHFDENFTFSWDPPRTKIAVFFIPRSKTRIFCTPLGQDDFTPLDKKAISSPPHVL